MNDKKDRQESVKEIQEKIEAAKRRIKEKRALLDQKKYEKRQFQQSSDQLDNFLVRCE